jgi:hypothetical protein
MPHGLPHCVAQACQAYPRGYKSERMIALSVYATRLVFTCISLPWTHPPRRHAHTHSSHPIRSTQNLTSLPFHHGLLEAVINFSLSEREVEEGKERQESGGQRGGEEGREVQGREGRVEESRDLKRRGSSGSRANEGGGPGCIHFLVTHLCPHSASVRREECLFLAERVRNLSADGFVRVFLGHMGRCVYTVRALSLSLSLSVFVCV